MHTARRATIATACVLLAAFLFTGCGVSAGEQAATTKTTTDTSSKDLSPTEQAMVDQAKAAYVKLGMDPDDADCLARGLVGSGIAEGTIDMSDAGSMMDVFNQCDIDMNEIANLGSENGLTSLEDGMKFGMESSLEANGLTKDEATCVADAYVDKYGTDPSAMGDQQELDALMKGCDVDPSKYGG